MDKVIDVIELDLEWIMLIKEAKQTGLSIEEIRRFLESAKRDT